MPTTSAAATTFEQQRQPNVSKQTSRGVPKTASAVVYPKAAIFKAQPTIRKRGRGPKAKPVLSNAVEGKGGKLPAAEAEALANELCKAAGTCNML